MDPTAFVLLATPVIIGLVQAVKTAGLDSRWAPLLSLALGAIAATGAQLAGAFVPPVDIFHIAIAGLSSGLAASGLYSGLKATIA